MDDEAHLDLLKEQYLGTIEFIQRLIEENKALAIRLEEKTLDHDSAAFACRTAQRELQKLQEKEGRMFKEELICLRKAGGNHAGRLMLQEITNKLSQTPAAGADIHIKVFANVPKLAGVLSAAERVYDSEAFREFVVGFTQTREHLYFIDVGDGKEMVDSRIRAELTWHLENYNCQKVLLGVSHDNGYARILSTIFSDGNAHKVLLLEGTPAATEVKQLSFQTTKLQKVFESRKLKIPKSHLPKLTPPPPPPIPPSPPTQPRSYRPPSRPATPAPSPSPHGQASSDQPPVVSTDIRTGLARIKFLHPPPCNDHYLTGTCWRNVCNYSHTHTLNQHDLDALRLRTSRSRCDGGEKCKIPNCYRGHACTNVRDGKCVRYNCPFLASEHPEGTVVEAKK